MKRGYPDSDPWCRWLDEWMTCRPTGSRVDACDRVVLERMGSKSRVALWTGTASGSGMGIAAGGQRRWQVVLADLDRERGAKVSRVLGDNAWFITMDVADEQQVALGVAEVLGQFGRLDALVCNAAVADPRNITLDSLDLAYWNRVLAVNLSGRCCWPALCALSACPWWFDRKPRLDRAGSRKRIPRLTRRARAACWP